MLSAYAYRALHKYACALRKMTIRNRKELVHVTLVRIASVTLQYLSVLIAKESLIFRPRFAISIDDVCIVQTLDLITSSFYVRIASEHMHRANNDLIVRCPLC